MKKYLISVGLIFFIAVIPIQSQFQLGVKGGFNSTHFNTENAFKILKNQEDYNLQNVKDDINSGFNLGAYMRIGLVGKFSLQPELYYNKKSGKTNYLIGEENTSTNIPVTEKLEYYSWDIPILVHFKLLDLRLLNLYALTGPVASFRTNIKTSFSDVNINEEINKGKSEGVNWNYQLGGGVEVWKLNFDVRYEWGLSNVSKTELVKKGNSLMFSLGFRLFGL